MTVILGIDPGSRLTGYGLVKVVKSRNGIARPEYVASGRIRLQSDALPDRLTHLHDALQTLVSEYQPAEVAIEQVFFGKNASSALKLGQARGVALLVPALRGIPVFEYSPRAIKQAVAGSGAADKTQVQDMVVRLLQLAGKPTVDAADALAAALCHQQHGGRARRQAIVASALEAQAR